MEKALIIFVLVASGRTKMSAEKLQQASSGKLGNCRYSNSYYFFLCVLNVDCMQLFERCFLPRSPCRTSNMELLFELFQSDRGLTPDPFIPAHFP